MFLKSILFLREPIKKTMYNFLQLNFNAFKVEISAKNLRHKLEA